MMNKIPKVIHYIWFGGGELNEKAKSCIETWQQIHPDYEIKLWDESNFDLDNVPPYIKDAYNAKVYAMVSDYARAKILYENGGWYCDTDVVFLKPFLDRYSDFNFVSPVECSEEKNPKIKKMFFYDVLDENHRNKNEDGYVSGVAICMSLIGAQRGCALLKDVMEHYDRLDWNKRDYKGCIFGGPIGPQIYAKCLEKYGFVYEPVEQYLDDEIYITGTEVMRNNFDDNTFDGITCAVHWCSFSWFKPFVLDSADKRKDGIHFTIENEP